jgi:two-component system chemotaxis response regulator CheB
MAVRKIKVLIVDDSAIVRRILSECLSAEPDLEVVGTAADAFAARDMIVEKQPDVLTLDIEMPRMDGLTFLRKLMQYRPMPVLIVSSLAQASCSATLQALEEGAVEALGKPAGPYSVGDLRLSLATKIRAAASARVRKPAPPRPAAVPAAAVVVPAAPVAPVRPAGSMIAIGASTGGVEAIRRVMQSFPADSPPVLITQHIPAGFSRAFADRLNRICPMEVKEAEDNDEVRPGRALLAPGGWHMLLKRSGSGYRVAVKDGPRVCYQKPSVDVLFSSVAAEATPGTAGILLTGMGADGAEGLLKMRRAGAITIAQDEASCVVFGMPREAIRLGAAGHVMPLDQIAHGVFRLLSPQQARAR